MDTEAVQKVMERLLKTQEEFRKAEVRAKLNDCQMVRVRGYQHLDKYVEGDKGRYQNQDSNPDACTTLYHPQNIYLNAGILLL